MDDNHGSSNNPGGAPRVPLNSVRGAQGPDPAAKRRPPVALIAIGAMLICAIIGGLVVMQSLGRRQVAARGGGVVIGPIQSAANGSAPITPLSTETTQKPQDPVGAVSAVTSGQQQIPVGKPTQPVPMDEKHAPDKTDKDKGADDPASPGAKDLVDQVKAKIRHK